MNITGNLNVLQTSINIDAFILPLGTYDYFNITNIQNSATVGLIEISTLTPNYLTIGNQIILSNTNSFPSIDQMFSVGSLIDDNTFIINGTIISTGNLGTLKTDLKTDKNKDVGIQINYWSNSLSGNSETAGSSNYITGFFGFKELSERWVFYHDGTNANDVFTGNLGDIEFNNAFGNIGNFNYLSSANIISTNLSNTNSIITNASINNLSLNNITIGNILYSLERLNLNGTNLTNNPSLNSQITFLYINGLSITTSGTMPNGLYDGQIKKIICNSIGNSSTYTLHFPSSIITPNPGGGNINNLLFKRQGQSTEIIWDSIMNKWIKSDSGVYSL